MDLEVPVYIDRELAKDRFKFGQHEVPLIANDYFNYVARYEVEEKAGMQVKREGTKIKIRDLGVAADPPAQLPKKAVGKDID